MKIVINRCYGGFGVSRDAFLRLRELQNAAALEEPDVGEFYDDGSGPRGDHGTCDSFGRDIPRDDTQLVAVVEKMGKKASSQLANLEVVEVPDGTEWTIEEYDGIEWVAEKHQTWP